MTVVMTASSIAGIRRDTGGTERSIGEARDVLFSLAIHDFDRSTDGDVQWRHLIGPATPIRADLESCI
jgi:hypothetical protein